MPTLHADPAPAAGRHWLPWLGLLLVPLAGAAAWLVKPDLSVPAKFVGACFAMAFWLWLAVFASGLHRRAPWIHISLFAGYWLALLVGGWQGGEDVAAAMRQSSAALLADVDRMQEAVFADQPKSIEDPFAGKSTASASMAAVDQFTRDLLSEFVQLRNAGIAELEQIGWPRLFDGDRLLQDRAAGFADSRRMVRVALAGTERRLAMGKALFDGLEQRAARYALSPQELAGVKASLARSGTEVLDRMQRIGAYEKQIIEAMAAQIEVLAADDGWTIDDGQITFTRDTALERFNALAAKVDELIAAQEKLQREGFAKGRERLERLAR